MEHTSSWTGIVVPAWAVGLDPVVAAALVRYCQRYCSGLARTSSLLYRWQVYCLRAYYRRAHQKLPGAPLLLPGAPLLLPHCHERWLQQGGAHSLLLTQKRACRRPGLASLALLPSNSV